MTKGTIRLGIAAVFALALLSCSNKLPTAADPTFAAVEGQVSLLAESDELRVVLFNALPAELNTTSVLIMGPTEMIVVDAQGTKSSAIRLADEIEATGLKLKAIFVTHAHSDHSQGGSVLLKRFPEAKFIATPKVAQLQNIRAEGDNEAAISRYGDNAAVPSPLLEPYDKPVLTVDGDVIELWRGFAGDVGLGYEDEPHTVAYIPSLHILIPSDIVYNNAHVFLGGTTKKSRAKWIDQLSGWLEKDYAVVVPGHQPIGSKLTATGALSHTLDYVRAFDAELDRAQSSDELMAAMNKRFPTIGHPLALHASAYYSFNEIYKLVGLPSAMVTFFDWLPRGMIDWIGSRLIDSRRKAANDLSADPRSNGDS